MKIAIYDKNGKKTEKQITLPKDIFEAKVNLKLMAQAVKVFLANQRKAYPKAKNRSEVTGSTKKIWRQKGTGRARHGDNKAPIFVGGGKAHGPVGIKTRLSLPKKMKKAALRSALSVKLKEEAIFVVDGLEKITPKTKQGAKFIKNLDLSDKKVSLYLVAVNDHVGRAFSNLPNVKVSLVDKINTYQTLSSGKIIFTKEAISSLKKRL
ncbi:MAG: 50S ribosomal protein L4 [Candidatus Shapirobacteria bacterium]|nr:50S ribosomal protein L4 [Candidatus Shapirobacteria bacterium]